MKQTIQERMERQISKVTAYNTLFDIVVTTSETSLSTQSTNPSDNQYVISLTGFTTNIICNDNDYNTVSVAIDAPDTTGMQSRIADVQININGNMEEDYHNIPRAIRTQILNLVDDIYEAIQGWIDNQIEE